MRRCDNYNYSDWKIQFVNAMKKENIDALENFTWDRMQSVEYAGKNFGGQGFGRPRRGCGGRSPPDAGEFSKICKKIFLKKLQKCIILAYFSKKFKKPCLTFSRIWKKITNSWEFLINFRKFSKKLFRKFQKIHYFSIFFEKFNKPCVNFSRVWTKNTNCWEIFEKIWWKFNRKIEFLSIFGKSCCQK